MSPLDVLLWAAAVLAALIVLSIVAFVVVFAFAAIVGLRRMQKDEQDTEIFSGRGES